MLTLGRHLLAEYHGCDVSILDDIGRIESLMLNAAEAAGATVVNSVFHQFSPQGVTGVVVVEESHLSIHTWPEYGYAAVDFYTCGECQPERAHEVLAEALSASRAELMKVQRGTSEAQPEVSPDPTIVVAEHFVEVPAEGLREDVQVIADIPAPNAD